MLTLCAEKGGGGGGGGGRKMERGVGQKATRGKSKVGGEEKGVTDERRTRKMRIPNEGFKGGMGSRGEVEEGGVEGGLKLFFRP